MSLRRFVLFSLILVAGRVTTLAAQESDIIRGQVTGPDGQPLENVLVTATALETNVSATKRTGKDGRYTIFFNNGDGDYMMQYNAVGFTPYGPVELKRDLDEAVLVRDVKLGKNPVMLNSIKSTANRQAVNPNDEARIGGIGSNDRTVDVSALPVGSLGDLASLAASLPGVTFIPGVDGGASGFSVLGLDASQNLTTLNGLNFDGSNLPAGATTTARVATNPFSASQGGFSGGQLRVTTAAGTNFVKSSQSENQDLKPLQFTDATGKESGVQYNQFDYNGNRNGPLAYNTLFYATAWEVRQKDATLQDLLNTSPLALERAGISGDSANKLIAGVQGLGVPTSNSLIPANKLNQLISGLTQFDWSPGAGHNFTLTFTGNMTRNPGSSITTAAVPTNGGISTTGQGGVALRHSSNFFDNFFDQSNMGVQYTHMTTTPYLAIPDASVRVTSAFADGAPDAVSNLAFGGNPRYPTYSENATAQFQNSTSWVSLDNKHRFDVGENYVYTRFNSSASTNLLGTYNYNTLSDFENNLPASFSRTLNPQVRDGNNLQQGYYINDAYTMFPRLQLQLGVRADIAQYDKTPAFDQAIDNIFGYDNTHVPNHVYVSPRFGFSYRYGTGPQIAGFTGASRGSNSQITGGFGLFRNLPTAQLVYPAIDANGLPTGAQQISCTGSAVPTPEWSQYLANGSTIPTTCANGSAGTVFSNAAPGVILFDPRNQSSVSNRANVVWRTPIIQNRWILSTGVTYSLNLDQAGTQDLNFIGRKNAAPAFTLAGEGNRPVYVLPSSIVTSTGAVPLGADAITNSFSHVTDDISDARSVSKQLQLQISPQTFNTTFKYSIAYTLQSVRDHNNGFSTNTDGNPLDYGWARAASDSRHQFQLSASYVFFNAVSFSATARVQSGNPYTPMVQGDINGDGYSDDRAFVYNPAKTTDTALVNGMNTLLNTAQPSVKQCLEAQLGTIAARSSCVAPWYTTMSANLNLVSSAFHLPQRATVTLSLANPLTGADAALHGWNNLHGWGQASTVNQNLLVVRGFNQSTDQFIYQVNQRFGAAAATNTASRTPFVMTLRVSVDVASAQQKQQLNLNLRQGRATPGLRMDATQLRTRYRAALTNPFNLMLQQSDSLKLTTDQSDSIAVLNAQYNRFVDSTWTPVVNYLAELPDDYNLNEAWTHVLSAYDQIIGKLLILGPAAKAIFSKEQLALLPATLAVYLDPAGIMALRPGNSNASARAGGFGGGGNGGGRGGGGN